MIYKFTLWCISHHTNFGKQIEHLYRYSEEMFLVFCCPILILIEITFRMKNSEYNTVRQRFNFCATIFISIFYIFTTILFCSLVDFTGHLSWAQRNTVGCSCKLSIETTTATTEIATSATTSWNTITTATSGRP